MVSSWLVLSIVVLGPTLASAQVPSLPSLNTDIDLGIVGILFQLPMFSIDLSCLNTTLILNTVDCFLVPFGLDLDFLRNLEGDLPINLSPYATDPKSTSRTLLMEDDEERVPEPEWRKMFANIARLQQNFLNAQNKIKEVPDSLLQQIELFQKIFTNEMHKMATTRERQKAVLNFERELDKGMKRLDINLIATSFLQQLTGKIQELPIIIERVKYIAMSQMTDAELKEYIEQTEGPTTDVELIPPILKRIACGVSDDLCRLINGAELAVGCMYTYPREAYEDGLTWMKCFYRCEDVRPMSQCFTSTFEPCGDLAWVGPLAFRALAQYLQLGKCGPFMITNPPFNQTLVDDLNLDIYGRTEPVEGENDTLYSYILEEGGEALDMNVVSNYHPVGHCVDFSSMQTASGGFILLARGLANLLFGYKCEVNLHVWTTNYIDALSSHYLVVNGFPLLYGEPVCRSQFLISQTKLGHHSYGKQNGNICEIIITPENWETERSFLVDLYYRPHWCTYLPTTAVLVLLCNNPELDRLCTFHVTTHTGTSTRIYLYNETVADDAEDGLKKFIIPLRATIDNKYDGDQTATLTLKQVIDGFHKETVISKIYVVDNDIEAGGGDNPLQQQTCQSTNDPHIITFDGHYYNNFYHGYFILYRHLTLPYEVQVVYQACGPNLEVSCNCAVAVKSGDDVFVFDRCAKEPDYCDPVTGFCGDEDHLYVRYYEHGERTLGTQIFQRYDGQRWEILLPHGQVVRITMDNHEHMLNVVIRPSVHDSQQGSGGLCGLSNGESGDDFVMRDGTPYTGEGAGVGEQPREFIEEWRAFDDELLFRGAVQAANDTLDVQSYCRCHQILLLGTDCVCEENIVETCDLTLDGEITHLLHHLTTPSTNTSSGIEGLVIDESYIPPDLRDWAEIPDWTQGSARDACRDYIADSLQNCGSTLCDLSIIGCQPFELQENGCMDDIRLTNNVEEWGMSAVEAAQGQCMDRLSRRVHVLEDVFDRYYNSMCAQNCSGNGMCENATCVCEPNFHGAICDIADDVIPSTRPVDYEPGERTIYCDTREQTCMASDVYGVGFTSSEEIYCSLNELHIYPDQVPSMTGEVYEGTTWLVSPNQLMCQFPDLSNYLYTVVWHRENQNEVIQNAVYFISYDSVCYSCANNRCELRNTDDYCLIDGMCYAPDEPERTNSDGDVTEVCHVCNPEYSTSNFDYMRTEECDDKYNIMIEEQNKQNRDDRLKLIMSIMLVAMICLGTIILYACYGHKVGTEERKRYKQQLQMKDMKKDLSNSNNGFE